MSALKAATASTVHEDAFTAGKEAILEVVDELGQPPDLLLLFVSSKYDLPRVVEGVHSRLPEGTPVVGCSSFAEVDADEALTASVTAMGLVLKGIEVKTFEAAGRADSVAAGREAGEAIAGFKPDVILAFPDVLGLNVSRFLEGLRDAVGIEVPIVGGAAADDGVFLGTHQIHGRRVIRGGCVGVALKGPIALATAAKSGYTPMGATHASTRVEDGKILLEIDGRPALNLYRDYLRERASEMPAVSSEFPIGVVGGVPSAERQTDDQFLFVRGIVGVDEARGALILGADIPEGAEIRITRATKQDILRGAEEATDKALKAMPSPDLALIFSCMSRKNVLGTRYKDECRAAFARLPAGLPKAGFYTFGELSPVQGVSMHHESTYTIVLLKAG